MPGAIPTFPHTLSSRTQTRLCEFSKDDVLCLIEDSAIEAYGGEEVELHAFFNFGKNLCFHLQDRVFKRAR